MLDPKKTRADFPIFERSPDLVYLDSAATALKPQAVLDAMNEYYSAYSGNVGRGLYPLSARATTAYENARVTIARFVHADPETIVFTGNATQAINLVALGIEESVSPENNIVVTALEHHSNYLPWKELARRRRAELRVAPFTPAGSLDPDTLANLMNEKTALIAFAAVSNVFGVVSPVTEIIQAIRRNNPRALIVVDACQWIGHLPLDFKRWDADFIVFSGHKLFGPTGIGVLAGKSSSLEQLAPKNVGGGTVLDACISPTEYKKIPGNLEGGTPNVAGAIGLGTAVKYIEHLGLENIRGHETDLVRYAIECLQKAFKEKIHILGSSHPEWHAGLFSFTLEGVHPHDLAHVLGEAKICVRAGEHCATPLHRSLNIPASTRISLSLYNTREDIDHLVAAMKKALVLLG